MICVGIRFCSICFFSDSLSLSLFFVFCLYVLLFSFMFVPSAVRNPRSAVHGAHPHSTVNGAQSTERSPRTALRGPQSTNRSPQSAIHGAQSTEHSPRSAVHGPQFADRSPWTAVHGAQSTSAVHRAQSAGAVYKAQFYKRSFGNALQFKRRSYCGGAQSKTAVRPRVRAAALENENNNNNNM